LYFPGRATLSSQELLVLISSLTFWLQTKTFFAPIMSQQAIASMREARGFNSLKKICDCRLGDSRIERLGDLSGRQVIGGRCLLQLGDVEGEETRLRRALWMSWFS
jgi:hypothetical protein